MRLLLVEDELDIQRLLKHSLAEAGYQVDAVGDARTAMKSATKNDKNRSSNLDRRTTRPSWNSTNKITSPNLSQ